MKSRTTILDLQKRKRQGRKIVMVTAYDATFARIVEEAGIDVMLVGDSLGVVVQGKEDTLSVTMEEMLYHTRMVTLAAKKSLVIADMPFLSYQGTLEEAIYNAGRFLQVVTFLTISNTFHNPRCFRSFAVIISNIVGRNIKSICSKS